MVESCETSEDWPGSGRGRPTTHGAHLRFCATWETEPRYNAVATFDAAVLQSACSSDSRVGTEPSAIACPT